MKIVAAATATGILMLCTWASCLAADPHAAPAEPSHATTAQAGAQAAHTPAANQAVLPPAGIRWPAIMMMIVVGMFIAAIAIGSVVRMNMPEEVPETHSHDESHGHEHAHGHDHGHGHGGHH